MTGAENLLSALWGNGENAVQQITTIKAGIAKNITVPSVSGAISKALKLDAEEYDVYHACAVYEDGQSRKASNARGAFGFWLDIDCGETKAAEGKGYLTKTDAVKALKNFLAKINLADPTHIIDSGNGLHVYFLCEKMIAKEEWLKSARQLKELTNYYGFFADDSRTADIASILRVPDTINHKDPANPKKVVSKHSNKILLNANELVSSIEAAYKSIIGEVISLPTSAKPLFPLEQLGVKKVAQTFEHSDMNRLKLLGAARAAFPDGIKDFESFKSLGLALASVVCVDGWPEVVAKDIFDDICSKPENANREKNQELWDGFISSTREKHSRGESLTGVGTIFHQALKNGWTDELNNKPSLGIDEFALITIGSKIGVVDLKQAAKASTATPLCIYSINDGRLLLKRKIVAHDSNSNSDKIVNQWLVSPNTTTFSGLEFNPAGTTEGYLNLWRGLSVKPIKGECNLIVSFIREIVCGGSMTHFEYLMGWLAHIVQKPQEKPGVSITLLGGQGIGKGMFASKLVGALYSDHFLHLQSDKALTGDFNDSLQSSFIVFADEAFFSGDKRSANILKAIETESRIHINPKFQAGRQIESFHRIISASNNDHATYVETDDRRKFILRVSEERKNDRAYWSALITEIESGGLEAFANLLLHWDISSFQVRNKPDTGELLKQKLASLDAIPQWWADRLLEGAQITEGANWSEWVSTSRLHEDFINSARAVNSRGRLPSIREFVDKLKVLCPDIHPSQQGQANSRKRGFTFPDLKRAREQFEQKLGGKISW